MLIVPLQATPSQTVMVPLGGQLCQINVYQKFFGLFIDLYVQNAPVVTGVLCENLNLIVRSAYLGFIGDFAFIDNQGIPDTLPNSFSWIGAFATGISAIGAPSSSSNPAIDPTWQGLGSRFSLAYLEASDLALIGAA